MKIYNIDGLKFYIKMFVPRQGLDFN
jgi:hypothetical protein